MHGRVMFQAAMGMPPGTQVTTVTGPSMVVGQGPPMVVGGPMMMPQAPIGMAPVGMMPGAPMGMAPGMMMGGGMGMGMAPGMGMGMMGNAQTTMRFQITSNIPRCNGIFTRNPRVYHFGTAWQSRGPRGPTLLYEPGKRRWILFCDNDGVNGNRPWFQCMNADPAFGYRGPWQPLMGMGSVSIMPVG